MGQDSSEEGVPKKLDVRITHTEHETPKIEESHIPGVEFSQLTAQGAPTEIRLEGEKYAIKASEKEISSVDFAGVLPDPEETGVGDLLLSLPEPVSAITIHAFAAFESSRVSIDAKKLVWVVANYIFDKYIRSMREQEMNDRLLNTASRPGQELSGKPVVPKVKDTKKIIVVDVGTPARLLEELPEDEREEVNQEIWAEYAGPKALEWLAGLGKKGFKVTEHSVQMDLDRKPISFRRIIIGDIKSDDTYIWETDRRLLEAAIFMRKSLGIPVPPDTAFYSIATLEAGSFCGKYFTSDLGNILDCGGFANQDLRSALVFEYSKLGIDKDVLMEDGALQAHKIIDTLWSRNAAAHEAAHLLSPFRDFTTSPQEEGFAMCIEKGFSFNLLKRELRGNGKYTREITINQIKRLLASKVRGDIPFVETYNLSATLFSYVFEKLGPEKFIEFYGLLTGAKDAVKVRVKKIKTVGYKEKYIMEDHSDGRRNPEAHECKGDIEEALRVIQFGQEGFDAKGFLDGYIEEINRPIKREWEKED